MPPEEEKAVRKPLKKLFRIALIVMAILLFLLAGSLVFISWKYGDRLKEIALEEVNQQLAIPIEVEEVNITIWAHFPNIAIDLKGLNSNESRIYGTQPKAISTKHAYLIFNPLDIIREKYNLKRIVLEEGELNLIIFWNGTDNYHFFKSGSDSVASASAVDLSFESIDLKEFAVNYRDLKSHQFHRFFIEDANIAGSLKDEQFIARANGNLIINELRSVESIFLSDKECRLDARIEVSIEDGSVKWSGGELDLDGIFLNSSGSIIPGENFSMMKMAFETEKASLEEVLRNLPESFRKSVESYNPKGKLSFSMSLEGESGDEHLPGITAEWSLEDASIRLCDAASSLLSHIQAEGKYESGTRKDYAGQQLMVRSMKGLMNDMPVKGRFDVKRFGVLLIEGEVSTVLDIDKLPECWKEDIPVMGEISLEGNFRYDEYKHSEDSWSEALLLALSGQFSKASFRDDEIGVDISDASASFDLKGGNLDIRNFKGLLSENAISGNMKLSGLLAWIDGISPKLDIRAGIKADGLPVAQWIESEGEETPGKAIWPKDISANIDVQVGEVHYKDFQAKALEGNIQLDKGFLYARGLKMRTMQGELELQGVLRPTASGFQLRSQTQLIGIDVSEMFRQLDDFGQQDLTHKNLSGRLDANIDLAMLLNEALMPSPASIIAGADLRITEGVIIDYAPLKELPKFIKAGNLDKVSIEPLENHITIKDEKVIIPEMAVNTDAMDLVVSGTHYFDQRIEYSIRVLLSEILGNKAKKENQQVTEFGVIEDDGLGRTTLFIKVAGTAQDPEFSYDRKGVLKKIGEDLKKESKELGKILREEFKWLGRDSVELERQSREEERIKQQESGKFIIEWDPDSL